MRPNFRSDVLEIDTIDIVLGGKIGKGLDERGTVCSTSNIGRIEMGAAPSAHRNQGFDILAPMMA